jgi:hypothetical protein
MSIARNLANLIGNIEAGGGGVNRNLVINGAMNVAQRGTSHASVANNAYTLDRFSFTYSQDGAFTVTQDSSSPDGFANSLKLDVTTADSSLAASQYLIMEHRIEAQNLQHLHFGKSSAKNITLSFYVKSNKTGTYGVSIIQSDNSSKIANLTYTINSADTWEEKSLTFTGDTSGVINDDNGEGLKVGFTLAVGSTWTSGATSASFRTFVAGNYGADQTVNILDSTSNEWFITGVQLEVGQNPTEFEHEPFERTLKKCERYFTRINAKGSVQAFNCFPFNGFCRSSTLAQIVIHWNQPMRSVPTMSYAGASDFGVLDSTGSTVAVSNISTSRTTENASVADWTSSSLSAGNGTRLLANNTADPFIDADAEL